ncbi:Translation initiation factor 2 [uncultured Gammaproteobacteria bacterium]|nr:Translation initiation factor 2 [uncultured Gammaproteobacteria bacterium]
MKNKYIKIALLSGFLVGSQVFAVNTIDTSIVTDNVTQISEVKALHVVKDATQQDYMKIISKKSGSTGNGDILRYRNDAQTNETYQCKRVNTLSMVEIVCGRDAVTNAFVNTINWHFANEGFAAEQIGTLLGERIVHLQLGKTSENWTLSGGIDGQEAVAQVVSFTPTVADNYKYYRISINSAEYSISVNKNTTINEIVEAFYNEMHNDSSVTCTEDDTKLTCTAYTAGDSFSYITSVVNRDETADERDTRLLEEARLAKEAWQNQLTVVTNSLTTANTAQANATTIVNGNDSLPSKLISINQSKQANGLFLLETQKLNGLKSDNPADNTIINNFYQQYQTLNTATNALMTNYTEQKRIADLKGVAWQNQLTVVTSSVTAANTAQANATTIMGNNYNSFPSKLASINQSKQANATLLSEIQKLDGVKRTNADSVTITNFNQQYQTLNTATNALMTNYTEQKRIADLEEATWQNQLTVVTSSLTAANTAQANATITMGNNYNSLPSKLASINQSKQANATLLSEIQKLDGLKRTDADSVTVTSFDQQYQTLNTATSALMANYEEQKRIAGLEATWQNQLTVVTNSVTAANTAQANATITMGNNYNSLPSKLASINQSKQANATLLSEIQKLDGLKRTDADSVTVTSFDQQYQTLNTATSALMANYTEQKRIADLEVAWQSQLTVVTSSLTTANTTRANATIAISNNHYSLPSKLLLINQLKQANGVLLEEIRKLSGLKRTDADNATVEDFEQQQQTLTMAVNALMVSYEGQKNAVDKATILTGYWKAPVIKGLDYATATHSSVTDENGAFKCQPGENVTFSIASLALTSIPCTEILNTKTTNNISLNATSNDGFKDWKDETNKQMLITKVLFGLFGKNIKTAFAQEDEALKFITVELTEAQKSNTMNRSLDANDLNLLVQNILGITEPVVLPTTEQAENMVTSGWQASKVFDGAISNDDSTDTGASTKSSSGGGCVYNPNAPARFDMGFILLMVLSAYYLIRRKRRFV